MSFNAPPPIADPADLMAAVAGAAEETQGGFPWIADGSHKLIFVRLIQKQTDKGLKGIANFVYYESTNPSLVGTICTKMYHLHAGKYPDTMDKELSAMRTLIKEAGGAKTEAEINAHGVAMLTNGAGRGVLIGCTGVRKSEKYVATYFKHIEGQTAEGIAAACAHLDTVAPMSLFADKTPAAQPAAQTPAAAPTSFGAAAAVAQPVAQATAAPAFKIPGL